MHSTNYTNAFIDVVVGDADRYPQLRPILTRAIDWALIRQQYDELVNYAAALQSGTRVLQPRAAQDQRSSR